MHKYIPFRFDKTYYRSFFQRWNQRWPSEASFIFVRIHKGESRLIFPDELSSQESLRLLRNSIPPTLSSPPDLGLYLRAARRSLRLTLKDVEQETGIAFRYLSALENGSRKVGSKTFQRLEKFFLRVAAKSPNHALIGDQTYIRRFPKKSRN